VVAVCLLTLTAIAVGLTLVSNADLFWHLASGRWELAHKAVLGFDPFSVDPQPEWVNTHWLFQALIAAVYAAGGFALLSVMKAAITGAMLLVFSLWLRRSVSPAWLMFSGLAMLIIMMGRIRVRPEIFSLAFMVLTIMILETVRRGAGTGRLWWLVPIMLAWVNMHSLYIVGMGLIWSSVACDWLDGRLGRKVPAGGLLSHQAMAPILAATVAVLVTPWPVKAALHPLLLWTRISGQSIYYTYGVSELRPTWQSPGQHIGIILLVALTAWMMLANRRRVPLAHAVWLTAMVALAAMARRNIGLIAPVVAYLLAVHGWRVLGWRVTGKRAAAWLTGAATAAMCLLLVAVCAAAGTSEIWRLARSSRRFGAGLQAEGHPIATAKFLKTLPGKGAILCENFGDASTFIYYSFPPRKVFMDGRLEAHSPERFITQHQIANELRTVISAGKAKLPDAVRFIFVGHDRRESLSALSQNPQRFKLIYLDMAGACFARLDWHLDTSPLPEPNFGDLEFVLDPSARPPARSIWQLNPPAPNYQLGAMLLSLGQQARFSKSRPTDVQRTCMLLAIRYLEKAGLFEEMPHDILIGTLAQAYQQRALQFDLGLCPAFPVDINSARSLYLYRQLDLTDLADPNKLMFAQQQILALKQARQIDAAADATSRFLEHLPPGERINPRRSYLELRDTLQKQLEISQVRATKIDASLSIPARAVQLASPSIGLTKLATQTLRAAGRNAGRNAGRAGDIQLLLGDLLLRQAKVAEARKAYDEASRGGADKAAITLREGLCLWVEGNFSEAGKTMAPLAASNDPIVRYYRAVGTVGTVRSCPQCPGRNRRCRPGRQGRHGPTR